MFGFLKSKKRGDSLTHHVYLDRASKFRMMLQDIAMINLGGGKALVVYHFDETGTILLQLLDAAKITYDSNNSSANNVLLVKAEQLANVISNPANQCLGAFVSEIHPISGKDELVYGSIHQYMPYAQVVFYTSLDSPVMKLFGGDKTQKLMLQLGLSDNEKIEHSVVTKSILRAQEKIKEKVQFEKPAFSKQEWIDLNVRS